MKEVRFFYSPEAAISHELPEEEAQHALRVLRLQPGDEIFLMDGKGTYYRAHITEADRRHCFYEIDETKPQPRQWTGHLHLAMGPTKNMDRTEWFAEKATEIGFDELTLLNCRWSERRSVKTERLDRILISAMKQSHKAEKPVLNPMTDIADFLKKDFCSQRFICHCHEGDKPLLFDVLSENLDAVVMIGPEGDFSMEEVRMAEEAGFKSVSLGRSRLRTETAALAAVHIMHLKNETSYENGK